MAAFPFFPINLWQLKTSQSLAISTFQDLAEWNFLDQLNLSLEVELFPPISTSFLFQVISLWVTQAQLHCQVKSQFRWVGVQSWQAHFLLWFIHQPAKWFEFSSCFHQLFHCENRLWMRVAFVESLLQSMWHQVMANAILHHHNKRQHNWLLHFHWLIVIHQQVSLFFQCMTHFDLLQWQMAWMKPRFWQWRLQYQ